VSEKELVNFTIDGQAVQTVKGTSILDAARSAGFMIPYYCYHPGLPVVGNCRMCLVEIEKIPKMQPSCATPAAEGMVVRTETPETLRNRKSVLEFLLLNHPLDCPVCDQAGECELQNYYMAHGIYDSRFNEDKTKRKKAFPIGPHVILDQERCILCTRCVRFTKEISKSAELAVIDRGHKSQIDVFPGKELNNPYSGNVVDICPVGALTDRDFRFQCRVWFLGRTRSICPGCSRGCNIEIHFNERFNSRYHDKRVQRLKPRFNADVNRFWMCDEGRYAYHAIDTADRLQSPRVRMSEGSADAKWQDAVRKMASALKSTVEKHGPESVAVLASPQMTNEELYSLRSLFREGLKVQQIEFRVPDPTPGFSDDFLITADKNPNTRGAEVIGLAGTGAENLLSECESGRIRFLYICRHDLTRAFGAVRVRAALGKVGFVVYQGSWENETAQMAHVVLPAAVYAEKDGTFTNCQGRVQKINAAVPPLHSSLPDLEIFSRLAAELEMPMPAPRSSDVFAELARQVQAFSGMTHETLGDTGQLIS
jgi:NADH-quinone oxidoreductase subunit G